MQVQTLETYAQPSKADFITKLHNELTGKIDFSKKNNEHHFHQLDHINNLNSQTITKLYGQLPKSYPCIFLVGWHESDGSGDIVFALKTAATLQREFPNGHVFIQVPKDLMDKTRFLCPKHLQDVLYDGDMEVRKAIAAIQNEVRDQNLKEQLIAQADKRALTDQGIDKIFEQTGITLPVILYEVATPTGVHSILSNTIKTFHIDEYNGWRIKNNHDECEDSCSWLTAGVGFTSIHPAVGVHLNPSLDLKIPAEKRREHLINLENNELKEILNPKGKHPLHFAYQSDGSNTSLLNFLTTLIRTDKQLLLDVIIVTKFAEDLFKSIKSDFKENHEDYPQFDHINYPLRYSDITTLTLSGKSKVRMIAVASVIHKDMITLMQSSQNIMHISGDQTLAEALSIRGNILFYQLQEWKQDLINELTLFAEFITSKESALVKFLKFCHGSEVSCDIDMEKLEEQFGLLHDKLKSWYTFDDWLIGSANRTLLEHHHAQLQTFEKHIPANKPLAERTLTSLFNRAMHCLQQQTTTNLKRRKVTKQN